MQTNSTARSRTVPDIGATDVLYSILFAWSAFFGVFFATVGFIAVVFWCTSKFCVGFSVTKRLLKDDSSWRITKTGGGDSGGTKRKFLTPAFSGPQKNTGL